MTSDPRIRVGHRRPAKTALTAAFAVVAACAVALAPSAASAASTTTLYVSSTGSGTACTSASPCSLTQARTSVEAIDTNMSGNIVVQLAGGTYRLPAPLTFGAADSGTNGYTITWQAASGQTPVISGGQQVTNWTLHDSAKNIWSAPISGGIDTRQLYVDGARSPQAYISISRSDVAFTSTGLTIQNSALNYLATLPEQNRIQLESQNSFTDHFSPVQSISGTTITMQQPAWNNNNWGYDTVKSPFAGGGLFLMNSYSFLSAGEWFFDPQAGQLYYEGAPGWSPTGHDIEMPQLTSLLQIGGSSYTSPAHNIAFQGISFEHTTWLAPNSSIGYADQQNGTFLPQAYSTEPSDFLTSCQSGCTGFEATRNSLDEVPAAVQVSAASNISFNGDTFTHLGEVGLGIGQDANAVATGVGLGASNITVDHNTFTDDAGGGVVAGGVQPDAHHPSNAAMTNQNITISNNLINGVAEDYKEMSGILTTYVTNAFITHNEVENLDYDGIDTGWGWGINDPGGSQDYVNRGTYNYQPIYQTPTTLKNNIVTYNKVHDIKKLFHDGGSLYNLSASPGSVFDDNYTYSISFSTGLYMDEGSRYVTLQNNVLQDAGTWAFANSNANNNTDNNSFINNWYNNGGASVDTSSAHNNVLSGNVQVSGTNWPSGAQEVINQAGVISNGGIGTARISAVGAGKCLDDNNSTTTLGTQQQIWDCNGGANQTWTRNSSGQISLTIGSTQLCLDDYGFGTTNGTKAVIWSCTGGTNQQWNINPNGTITSVYSGLCLDVTNLGTSNGTLVELWTCHGGTNQRWARV